MEDVIEHVRGDKMQEEIEQLKKYVDLCESKIHYHKTQEDRWEIEINKTESAIKNLREKLSTLTDFKSAKELLDEKDTPSNRNDY